MADNQEGNPTAAAADGAADQPTGPQFALQRIYLKDSSFESPRSPAVFQSQWQPTINFDIKTKSDKIQESVYEVVLMLTVEAKLEDQAAFLVEVHQAGIFTARDFDEQQLEALLATVCPNILFPYAREVIDSLVTKGSFPQMLLTPVNFDALYAQHMQELQTKAAQQVQGGEGQPTTN